MPTALFSSVELAPRDPILGLNEAFNADSRANKVNLGVGVYCDDEGRIPLLQAVREAERQRIQAEWQERQRMIRERDYAQADALRELAQKILDEGPKFIRATRRLVKGQDGQPDREVITLALQGDLAVKAIEAASKLQRLAAEMPPPKQVVDASLALTLENAGDVAENALRLLQERLDAQAERLAHGDNPAPS